MEPRAIAEGDLTTYRFSFRQSHGGISTGAKTGRGRFIFFAPWRMRRLLEQNFILTLSGFVGPPLPAKLPAILADANGIRAHNCTVRPHRDYGILGR